MEENRIYVSYDEEMGKWKAGIAGSDKVGFGQTEQEAAESLMRNHNLMRGVFEVFRPESFLFTI